MNDKQLSDSIAKLLSQHKASDYKETIDDIICTLHSLSQKNKHKVKQSAKSAEMRRLLAIRDFFQQMQASSKTITYKAGKHA